jgi:arylsulfatase
MAATRPNVIIILTDDQGYGDLACHGNPVALTPHLDRLHGQSVRLTDFHAAPMCTPTRGQLMTGLDAARNGALNVSSGRTLLRSDLPTMADAFRDAGYSTGLFGKWHLGDNYPYRPQDRGFDETLWFPSSHISSAPDYWENDYFDDVYCRNGERVRHTGYCTEVFFDEAIRWIGERKERDEPFFLYLPTNAPHSPLWVPKEDLRVVEDHFAAHEHLLPELRPHLRACIVRFLAMIRNLDTQIGRLRALLEEQKLADDTLLMFMTDNGSTFGHQYFNAGMRGNKTTLWEGGHRVPCFLHWPSGGLGDPRDIPGLTEAQDLLPTLASLCGLETDPGDGVDLTPALRTEGTPPEDRMLVVNYSRMPGALDYPSPDADSFVRREGAAVLWKRWRLLETDQLYDLDADPLQEHNVIDDHPGVAREMLDHLDAWWADVETAANELQRVIVGHDAENPAMLSACEWADVFVDQQQQIRVGVQKNSYWHIHVAQDGEYTFELRRWPVESGLGLMDACPEAAVPEDGLMPDTLIAGTILPISRARLLIGGETHVQEIDPDAQSARFTVNLKAGPALLHTWFDDARRQPICGAYYVYVERKR